MQNADALKSKNYVLLERQWVFMTSVERQRPDLDEALGLL
jgi:hypothetical protein